MILPGTYIGALLVMILGLLCVGLWANTFKLAGRLRYELYYVDFAIGLGFAAVILGFTFGNMGFDGFSLLDDILQAHKREWLEAFGAGAIFNLANMFLVGAISVSGMATAIPVALGVSLFTGILLGQIGQRNSNPVFLYLGCALILAAVVAEAMAHSAVVRGRKAAIVKEGKSGRRAPGPSKALTLSIISGLLMVGVYPLANMARTGDAPLGPYSVTLLMAFGAFISTFIYSLFFMNLPVQGSPLEIRGYFKMHLQRHGDGLLGGIVFCAGAAAVFVAATASTEVHLERGFLIGLGYGGALVAALCGLLYWKEFDEGGGRAKRIASAALVLFAGGLALISLSQV